MAQVVAAVKVHEVVDLAPLSFEQVDRQVGHPRRSTLSVASSRAHPGLARRGQKNAGVCEVGEHATRAMVELVFRGGFAAFQ